MKYGIYYFLRCKYVILGIRVLFLVSLFLTFRAPKYSLLFPIFIVVSIIFGLFNVITAPVRVPSEKEVKDFMEEREHDYVSKVKADNGLIGDSRVRALKAFSQDKKINLSRQIGYDIVYSDLLIPVTIQTPEGIFFSCFETSLLKKDEGHELFRTEFRHGEKPITVNSAVYDEDFHVVEITISGISPDFIFRFVAKDDFHLREVLGMLEDYTKKE